MEGNPMKKAFLTVMFLCLFVLGTSPAQAQEYAPGYYDPSWGGPEYDPYYELEAMHYNQFHPQQYDPYYELEVMHYRLDAPQFHASIIYPYPPYTLYPPCCVPGGY
jgi:hypothetical protein